MKRALVADLARMSKRPSRTEFPGRLFEAIDASGWADLERMLRADAEYQRPGYAPLRGAADIMRFYREDRIVNDGRHVLSSTVIEDDHIFCHGVFEGHDKNGVCLRAEFGDFYKLVDGLLSFRKTFFFTPLI